MTDVSFEEFIKDKFVGGWASGSNAGKVFYDIDISTNINPELFKNPCYNLCNTVLPGNFGTGTFKILTGDNIKTNYFYTCGGDKVILERDSSSIDNFVIEKDISLSPTYINKHDIIDYSVSEIISPEISHPGVHTWVSDYKPPILKPGYNYPGTQVIIDTNYSKWIQKINSKTFPDRPVEEHYPGVMYLKDSDGNDTIDSINERHEIIVLSNARLGTEDFSGTKGICYDMEGWLFEKEFGPFDSVQAVNAANIMAGKFKNEFPILLFCPLSGKLSFQYRSGDTSRLQTFFNYMEPLRVKNNPVTTQDICYNTGNFTHIAPMIYGFSSTYQKGEYTIQSINRHLQSWQNFGWRKDQIILTYQSYSAAEDASGQKILRHLVNLFKNDGYAGLIGWYAVIKDEGLKPERDVSNILFIKKHFENDQYTDPAKPYYYQIDTSFDLYDGDVANTADPRATTPGDNLTLSYALGREIPEAVNSVSRVNLIFDNDGWCYVFNNETNYVPPILNDDGTIRYKKKYGLTNGTYRLTDISSSRPIAILNSGKENEITYTGDSNKKLTIDVSGVSYDFYYGDISINVTGNFGEIGFQISNENGAIDIKDEDYNVWFGPSDTSKNIPDREMHPLVYYSASSFGTLTNSYGSEISFNIGTGISNTPFIYKNITDISDNKYTFGLGVHKYYGAVANGPITNNGFDTFYVQPGPNRHEDPGNDKIDPSAGKWIFKWSVTDDANQDNIPPLKMALRIVGPSGNWGTLESFAELKDYNDADPTKYSIQQSWLTSYGWMQEPGGTYIPANEGLWDGLKYDYDTVGEYSITLAVQSTINNAELDSITMKVNVFEPEFEPELNLNQSLNLN